MEGLFLEFCGMSESALQSRSLIHQEFQMLR